MAKTYLYFEYKTIKLDDEKCIQITKFDNSITNPEVPSSIEGLPVRSLGSRCFAFSFIQSVLLPNTLKEINSLAFSQCSSLRALYIPDSVKSIGAGICSYCSELESVRWSKNVNYIPANAFCVCGELTEVSNIDHVVEIGSGAFELCHFTSFRLPPRLKTIRKDAFACCYKLKEIEAKKAIPNTDKKAFYDVPYIMVKCRGNSSAEKWAKKIGLTPVAINVEDSKLNTFLSNIETENKTERDK